MECVSGSGIVPCTGTFLIATPLVTGFSSSKLCRAQGQPRNFFSFPLELPLALL